MGDKGDLRADFRVLVFYILVQRRVMDKKLAPLSEDEPGGGSRSRSLQRPSNRCSSVQSQQVTDEQ